ncbi:acyl-CoA dehydrogenase family protein [Listeria innocua]|nr:acyl-CoA dehydrogenase family protein [Listeria innocua]
MLKNITDLNEELILETVEKFSDVEIAPYWSSIDRTGNLPKGLFDKMVNLGLLSLTVPEEYGGVGANPDIAWKVIYELSKRSASIGCILEGHYKTVDQLKKYASSDLKEEYLPQANERIFGFSSTEPSGGTNVQAIRTVATPEKKHWIQNGSKMMITNGSLAEVYCVIAKTSDNKFSCFLVDMKMPGFKFGPLEDFMGLRGCPVGTLFFDSIVLPKNHLLGKEGEGLIIGNSAHYDARIGSVAKF